MANIDFNKVLTNVLSVFIATLVISAAAIVWNGATSVEKRIGISENKLQKTIEVVSETTEKIGKELEGLKDKQQEQIELFEAFLKVVEPKKISEVPILEEFQNKPIVIKPNIAIVPEEPSEPPDLFESKDPMVPTSPRGIPPQVKMPPNQGYYGVEKQIEQRTEQRYMTK